MSSKEDIGRAFHELLKAKLEYSYDKDLQRRVQILTGYQGGRNWEAGKSLMNQLCEGYIYGYSTTQHGRRERFVPTQRALLALNTGIEHPIIGVITAFDPSFYYPPTNYILDLAKLDASDIASFLTDDDRQQVGILVRGMFSDRGDRPDTRSLDLIISSLDSDQAELVRYACHRLVIPYFNRDMRRQLGIA